MRFINFDLRLQQIFIIFLDHQVLFVSIDFAFYFHHYFFVVSYFCIVASFYSMATQICKHISVKYQCINAYLRKPYSTVPIAVKLKATKKKYSSRVLDLMNYSRLFPIPNGTMLNDAHDDDDDDDLKVRGCRLDSFQFFNLH